MSVGALAAVCGLGLLLVWQYHREAQRAQRWRSQLLDDCAALPDLEARRSVDTHAFARLDGIYAGTPVAIELIHDDTGFRKLPVLWLSVTFATALPGLPAISATNRVQGTEFWTAADQLPHRVPAPEGCPNEVIVRTAVPGPLPPVFTEAAVRFFGASTAKELVLSARGARLVCRAGEARRADYLVLRKSRFGFERVDAALARSLLDHGAALLAAMRAQCPAGTD
jgi:hypothetical protein